MDGFRARACPRDHAPLRPERVDVLGPDVKVDVCPTCHGVFLDKNELLRITKDARLNAFLRDQVGFDSDSALLCPHCGGVMDAEAAAGATVDVCLTCYGIWLDKGELDALRARRREAPLVTGDKEVELDRAVDVKRRVRVEEKSRQGAVGRRLVWLDDAMDEIVRRWL